MRIAWWLPVILLGTAASTFAQSVHGTVIDQTGAVLPGVRIEVRGRDGATTSTTSAGDGTFDVPAGPDGETVDASLDGFVPVTMPISAAARIMMTVAGSSETTVVSASSLTSSGVVMERLGSTLDPRLAQKLPAARPRVMESLPLLPSVVRGPDGLLRLGGARPHEASLWIDGFDVTDPVTGTSAIDLPLEGVRGVAVLRDPMAATFGGMLGGLASIETAAGGDSFAGGVQSFVPHPRVSRSHFGRIDGFFPRAYVSGRRGAVHYMAAQEYDFERIPVPGVTTRGRPMIGELSATSFARLDAARGAHQAFTIEAIVMPGRSAHADMSPLRPPSAAPTVHTGDLFAGATDRIVVSHADVITLRAGLLAHDSSFAAASDADARLTPAGWRDNWFASIDHRARRAMAAIAWDHSLVTRRGTHTISVAADAQQSAMRGTVRHEPIAIDDAAGRVVRRIDFGPSTPLRASASDLNAAVRDRWDVNDRWQLDVGIRRDSSRAIADHVWSPRAGVRYQVDASGATVIKAGAGQFVGRLPLHALAFGDLAPRIDTTFSADGAMIDRRDERFSIDRLRLPRARTVSVEVEQRIRPGLDVQFAARRRTGSKLPTVMVPAGGDILLASSGASRYREWQIAARQAWNETRQVFVSYVRSHAEGELNDFATTFADLDTPLLEPGGQSVINADAPNRVVAWGTMALSHAFVVSPAAEWHTGFPYSTVDVARHYAAAPNDARLPRFFSLDMVVYRTVAVRSRSVDLGAQFFNLTRHFNPRNAMTVVGTPQFGMLANSVGLRIAGYMTVKWR